MKNNDCLFSDIQNLCNAVSDWLIKNSIIQLKPTRQYPMPVVTSCVITAEPVNVDNPSCGLIHYSVIFPTLYIKTSSYWVYDLKSFVGQCNIRLESRYRNLIESILRERLLFKNPGRFSPSNTTFQHQTISAPRRFGTKTFRTKEA